MDAGTNDEFGARMEGGYVADVVEEARRPDHGVDIFASYADSAAPGAQH